MSERSSTPRQQMEAVWLQRARRLSQRVVPAEAGQNSLPVITLGLGHERYGIDLADVAEVLPPVWVTPVPGVAALFAGVINVHGEIRPVLDLRRWLGIEASRKDAVSVVSPRVILLRHAGREMGLRIDSVEQIRWLGPGELQPPVSGGAVAARRFKAITKDLLTLLSTEALFAELQEGVTN
jgi:chemotaxis signal transduction protein